MGDFTTNPHAWIARFGLVNNHYAIWAISTGALIDLDPEPPHRRDVLDPDTLRALPSRVRLRRGKVLR